MIEHPAKPQRKASLVFRQIGDTWQFWNPDEGWIVDNSDPVGPSDCFDDIVISYESTWAEPCAGDL